MTPGRITALMARFGLPPAAAGPLARLAELLADDPLAPTSVRDRGEVIDVHLADSLSALALAPVQAARELVDIGAGAGLPGLPLAIALPHASVTLLDSTARKCEFIARTADAIGAGNVSVVTARAEAWPAGAERADVVTARAVAPLDVVAEYAAPLLRLGGVLVVWRGRRDPQAEAAADRAADLLGLVPTPPIPTQPFPSAAHHHLHMFCKLAPTPSTYPRRTGVARKRPLGAGPAPSDRPRR